MQAGGGWGCPGREVDSKCQTVLPSPSWVLYPLLDAFWAPAFCLNQAHTLSWHAHALGFHAHTPGPCPCLSPHFQGRMLTVSLSFTAPLLGIPCANLASVVLSRSTRLYVFHLPLTSSRGCHTCCGRAGRWKLLVADKASDYIMDTMVTWLNPFCVPILACFFFLLYWIYLQKPSV